MLGILWLEKKWGEFAVLPPILVIMNVQSVIARGMSQTTRMGSRAEQDQEQPQGLE